MTRILLVAAALAASAGSGCATAMNVGSHVREGLDITQYRTYDWGPADALPTGDPRLDANPFFQDHVQGAVEKQFAARGIARVTTGTPDVLVHYHASIDTRIDVNRTERAYLECQGAGCAGWTIEYEAGTLVLDIVDARTNSLIWRGWARESVEGVLGHDDRMAEQIRKAVGRIFERFPAR